MDGVKKTSNYSCPGKVESVNTNNKIRFYMLKVIHGPFRLFGCCQLLFGSYLKHHLRWNCTSPTHSLSSPSLLFSLRTLVSFVWSDLTCWFGINQTQVVMAPVYLLFLRTCATARSQLVWDVSVFVFGMEHFVASFCYLRNKAVLRHVCVPADEARQEKIGLRASTQFSGSDRQLPECFFHHARWGKMDPARVTSPF